jgi:histidine triad (HIT) family protein
MEQTCPFCQIIAGERPGRIVYRDDLVTAFWDRAPITPIHILIVPNKHIASLNEANHEHQALLGHLMLTAKQVARDQGIFDRGYRVLINTGRDGGQTVHHLHVHLIGGKPLPIGLATA